MRINTARSQILRQEIFDERSRYPIYSDALLGMEAPSNRPRQCRKQPALAFSPAYERHNDKKYKFFS